MSHRILFFGNERLATSVSADGSILRSLVDAGYDVAAVVVAQDEIGPSRKGRQLEIEAHAQSLGIPLLKPASLAKAKEELAALGAEAAILVAYGNMVPQSVIDIFPRGIINIHPSLLPKHRGSIPIESVILNGEATTGVSLMALVAEMDAGPIYAQAEFPLSGTESKEELVTTLRERGRTMLVEHLPAILDGSLQPQPQDSTQATYDERIDKQDGVIDWSKPAAQLEREIRAYLDWPRSRTKLGAMDVIITGSHVADGGDTPGSLFRTKKELGVYCGEGLLMIDTLVPAGKKEMPAQAFLAGYGASL